MMLPTGIYIVQQKINANSILAAFNLLDYVDKDFVNAASSVKRRNEVTITRGLLKQLFGRHTRLLHDDTGAPHLEGQSTNISISHSGDTVCIAYSDYYRLGIDIQHHSPALRRTAPKYLSGRELTLLDTYTDNDLLRLWTAKEAVYKLLGIKNLSLRDIDIINSTTAILLHDQALHKIALDTNETAACTITVAYLPE